MLDLQNGFHSFWFYHRSTVSEKYATAGNPAFSSLSGSPTVC
jgi:hypothetical protein